MLIELTTLSGDRHGPRTVFVNLDAVVDIHYGEPGAMLSFTNGHLLHVEEDPPAIVARAEGAGYAVVRKQP
jgi:hypothetical protein